MDLHRHCLPSRIGNILSPFSVLGGRNVDHAEQEEIGNARLSWLLGPPSEKTYAFEVVTSE